MARFLEDFAAGQKFRSGRLRVEAEQVKRFAAEFDPQPFPVRPGDELHLEVEVLEVRPSKSRPQQGLVKLKTTTLNQNGEPVQVSVGNLVVPRRRSPPGSCKI